MPLQHSLGLLTTLVNEGKCNSSISLLYKSFEAAPLELLCIRLRSETTWKPVHSMQSVIGYRSARSARDDTIREGSCIL